MRFAASPILVAVALGLLGPVALDDDDDGRGPGKKATEEMPESPDVAGEGREPVSG